MGGCGRLIVERHIVDQNGAYIKVFADHSLRVELNQNALDILGVDKSGRQFDCKRFCHTNIQCAQVNLSQWNLLITVDCLRRSCHLDLLVGNMEAQLSDREALRHIDEIQTNRNDLLLEDWDGHSGFGDIADHIF